jgi:hypothetical protein
MSRALSEQAVKSIIAEMTERYTLDMTPAEVQAIAAKQDDHFFEVVDPDGIDDTMPREYWLDAIAREWAGRDEWPCNASPDDPTFVTDLVAGYKHMVEARTATP